MEPRGGSELDELRSPPVLRRCGETWIGQFFLVWKCAIGKMKE